MQRPTRNKGFDFTLNVETLHFKLGDGRRHRKPSHGDIVAILANYKAQNMGIYPTIKKLINQIYQCQNININELTQNFPHFTNYDGEPIPIAVILLCIKWLFIEQDITYWNYSGRNMLFSYLQKNKLA